MGLRSQTKSVWKVIRDVEASFWFQEDPEILVNSLSGLYDGLVFA